MGRALGAVRLLGDARVPGRAHRDRSPRPSAHLATAPPPPNETNTVSPPLRIFVFGGSTAWGRGARDDFTIPSLLAKQLSDRATTPISVSNYGQSGWVSTQERIALALEIQRGNVPDLVVFYDGVNDVFAAYQSGEVGIPQNEVKRRVDFEAFEVALLARVADRSALFRLARRIRARDPLGLPAARTDAERHALADSVVDAYLGNMQVVAALAEEFEFTALHFWQPVLFSKSSPTPLELEISDAFAPLRPLYAATYARVREREDLRAHAGFRDIQDALDDEGTPSFFDYCHVGEGANAVIAGRVAEQVEGLLAVRASRKRGESHAAPMSD